MQVEVITATENPMDVISIAAGTCFGKSNISHKRVETCHFAGHLSVFEHASITFKVEGISRSCMAQLTRHRLASFCVESQRYCKYDLGGSEWYVTPPSILESSFDDWYCDEMRDSADGYAEAISVGIKPEDARYLLPEATKTNLVVTMNVRNLFHLFDMRLDRAAQWEIRELVAEMKKQAAGVSKQWRQLMELHGAVLHKQD